MGRTPRAPPSNWQRLVSLRPHDALAIARHTADQRPAFMLEEGADLPSRPQSAPPCGAGLPDRHTPDGQGTDVCLVAARLGCRSGAAANRVGFLAAMPRQTHSMPKINAQMTRARSFKRPARRRRCRRFGHSSHPCDR